MLQILLVSDLFHQFRDITNHLGDANMAALLHDLMQVCWTMKAFCFLN